MFFRSQALVARTLVLFALLMIGACGFEPAHQDKASYKSPKVSETNSQTSLGKQADSYVSQSQNVFNAEAGIVHEGDIVSLAQVAPASTLEQETLASRLSAIADAQALKATQPEQTLDDLPSAKQFATLNTSATPRPTPVQRPNLDQAISQPASAPIVPAHPGVAQENVAAFIRTKQASMRPALEALYAQANFSPLWYGQAGWRPVAVAAAHSLAQSHHDGFPQKRYVSAGSLDLISAKTAEDIAVLDLRLSKAVALFLTDLSYGLDPKKKRPSGMKRLHQAISDNRWDKTLERYRPTNRHYVGLSHAMRSGILTSSQKITLMINMERLRDFKEPQEQRYIHVNLPSQRLAAYDQGQVDMIMPVAIGQLSRQTPVIKDRITNLKFSPDWTVPTSIANKDILPILRAKGADLTKKMNLQVYRGNKKLNPYNVNWKTASASSFRFRQPPGPGNALGGVRFSLTNPRGIFLHDTPSRDLFERNTRVVSSGCVRVGNAAGLAHWLLKDQGWSMSQIRKAMTQGKSRFVDLPRDVPVYFTYNTAQVDEQGRFELGRDLYGLDAALGIQLGLY